MTALTAPAVPRLSGRASVAAGFAYAGAWLAGLAVVQGPALDATDADVVRHFSSHGTAAIAQSLLVHVVAGVLLGVVAGAVADRRARVAGLTAATISIVQGAVGIAASLASSAMLFDLVNRIDGVKMVVLAAFAALVAAATTSKIVRGAAAVAVPTLLVAAAGYLTLSAGPAVAAAPALLALLVLVPATARAER